MKKRHAVLDAFKYVSLIIAMFGVFFPPLILILNAFKSSKEFGQKAMFALPDSFLNLSNFREVFDRADLAAAFGNTVAIIGLALIGNVLFGTMFCYAMGRFEFKGKSAILAAFMVATVIPSITTQVATFKIIQGLGLYNTLGAPVLLYIGTDVLQIYIFLQFVRNIPMDLDEAAMMEGASFFKIYYSVILPLLAPATATVIILKTIAIYNDMFIPFLYMPSAKLGVVSTSLMRFFGVNSGEWNMISAAILLILIPTVVLYLFLQRYIFAGVTSGAVK